MLKRLILVFYTALQPVIAVKIKDDAALVEPMMAFGEVCLHDETEILFLCLHLEHGGVVVAEMIVCTLPKIGVRLGCHLYGVTLDDAAVGQSRPFEIVDVKCNGLLDLYGDFMRLVVVFA